MGANAPGRTFLKVTGILSIIYGAFLVLSCVGSTITYRSLTSGDLPEESRALFEQMGVDANALLVSIIFVAVGAVLFLAAGIIGVINNRKVEKAGICVIMGILLVAYFVINFGYSAVTTGVTVGSIISTVIMLIVPLLYLWGALRNKEVSDGSASPEQPEEKNEI